MVTSITSGTVSSAGIGSGLDVNKIVDAMLNVEKVPLTNLQTTATTIQSKLSAFGQIQSFVSSFRDASADLQKADSFAATTAGSSDTASVAASSTTKAVPGAYSVQVNSLASTQNVVSADGQFAAATDVVGTGSITIDLGSYNADQTTFTPKPGAISVTVPIGADDKTLAGVRDKINAANAGVTASLVTDANGSRLALQSSATGAANGFRVRVATGANDDPGLARLAFDPTAGPPDPAGSALTQAAANTKATINGIPVETAGATLDNVVDGITFNVSKVTTSPVTVSVTRNTDSVKSLLTNFVASYNALASFLSSATAYDPAAKKGALLQGDATTTGLQNQLRSNFNQPAGASSAFSTFSSLGIEFQSDGRLKINDTKLDAALTKLPEVAKALSNLDGANPGNNGLARKLTKFADGLLSSGGSISGKTQSYQSQIASNQKNQDSLTNRISASEARIRAQYTALDATVSKSNALQSYVTQQFAVFNKSNN